MVLRVEVPLHVLEEAGDYSPESVSRMAGKAHADVVWSELVCNFPGMYDGVSGVWASSPEPCMS